MLDKTTFITYTVQPQNPSLNDVMLLENAVKKYPYFNLAYSLIAKGNCSNMLENTTDAIKKAAIYAQSRNALRKLIEDDLDWINYEKVATVLSTEVAISTPSDAIEEEFKREKREEDILNTLSKPTSLQNEQLVLIENFIKNEPRISPIKALPDIEEEDLSESSTILKGELITETYAKVLAMQGNFAKSIEVYYKLIAKNPEKMAYFAEKIDTLKKKMT